MVTLAKKVLEIQTLQSGFEPEASLRCDCCVMYLHNRSSGVTCWGYIGFQKAVYKILSLVEHFGVSCRVIALIVEFLITFPSFGFDTVAIVPQ